MMDKDSSNEDCISIEMHSKKSGKKINESDKKINEIENSHESDIIGNTIF